MPATLDTTTLPDANTLLGGGSTTALPDAHALLGGSTSSQNSSAYSPPSYSANAPFYEKSMLNDLGQCTGRECGEEISHYLPQSATSLDQPQNFVQPDSHGNYPEGTIMHVAPDPGRGRFDAGHYFVVHYINGVPHRLESNVVGHDVVSDSRPLSPADIDAATRGGVVHAYAPGGMRGVQVASNPSAGLPDANQLLGSTTPPVSDSSGSLPDANALLGTPSPQPEQSTITPHEERLFQSMNAQSPFLGPENMLAGKTAWGGPLPTNAQANDIGFNQGMAEIDAATNQNTALQLGLPKNATPAQINAAIKALDHPAWSQNFSSKQQPFDINQTFDTQGQPGTPVHPADNSQAPAPANAKPWYKQIIPNIKTGLTNLYNQYEASPEGHLPSLLQPQSPANTLKAVEGIGGQIVGLIGGTVNLFAAPLKPVMRYTEAGMAYQDPQFSEQISRTAGKQTDAAVNTLASAVPFLGNESAHMAINGLTSMSRGDMSGANKLMSAIPQFGTELRDDPFGQIGQAAVVFAPLILHGLKVAGSNAALAKTLGDTADAAKANDAVTALIDHANNITENSPAAAQAFTDATHEQNQPLTPDIQHIADAEAQGVPYTATVEQMAQYHEMPVEDMKAKIDRSVARGVTQDLGDGTYKFVPAAARATTESTTALPAVPGTYSPKNATELAPVLQTLFNTDAPHAQALAQLYDARAKTWAAENNTTPEQWYATKQFVNGSGPTADTLNQGNAPTFYSHAEDVIQSKMGNKASVDQVRGMLQSNGVKPDEMHWAGINDFLDNNAGKPILKSDLLDHIQQNNVQIEEVEKGQTEPQRLTWKKSGNTYFADGGGSRYKIEPLPNGLIRLETGGGMFETYPNQTSALDAANQSFARSQKLDTTKYGTYQIPGGSNYREMLLTLPETDPKRIETFQKINQMEGVNAEQRQAMIDVINRNHPNPNNYQSSHWDEPNVLGHIRMSDRTGPNGEKILHVEEMQSDWHQAGRKEGYRTQRPQNPTLNDAKQFFGVSDADWNRMTTEDRQSYLREMNSLAPHVKYDDPKMVPNAPFSKSWPELLSKRVLRYAAEHGYDKVAWTPGEIQGKRYSEDAGGPLDQARTAGMKGFYDKIVPDVMNKIGKRFGAKVSSVDIPTTEPRQAEAGQFTRIQPLKDVPTTATLHSIDITPSMKKSVLEQGQPLFQKHKASITFNKDGTAIVRALSNPDVSSVIHELGHIIRRDLPVSDQAILENHYGVQNSKWTRPQEEKFARHFEGYVREGIAPTEGLKTVFAKLSAALKEIYQRWRGTAHPEVKAVLDRALGKGSESTEKAPVAKSATTEAVPKPTEPKAPPAEDDKYAESLNLVRNTMNDQQKAIAREQMGLAGVHKPDSVSFAEQRIRGNALGLTNEYVRGKVKGEIPKQLSEDQRGDYLNSLRSLMQHNLNKVEELSRVPVDKRSADFTKALTKATEDYQATLQDYSPIVNRMGRSFGNLADNARAFEAASRGDIFKEQPDVVKLGKTKRSPTAWDRGATNTTYTQKAAQDAIAKLQAKGLIKDSNTLYQSVGKEPLRANSPLKDPETAAALRELGGYYLEATGNWNNWTRAMVSHVPSLTDADLRNIHDSIRADVEAKTGVVQSPDAPTVTMAKTLARRLGPNAADIIKAIPEDMQESISNKMAARLPFSKEEDAAIAKAFSETIKGVKPNGVRRYPQLDAAMLAARKTYNAQKALSDKWKAMQSGRLAIRDGILKTLPTDKVADFSKEFAQIPNDASDSSFKRLAETWNKWGPENEGKAIFNKLPEGTSAKEKAGIIAQRALTNGHLLAQLIRAGYLTGTHVIGKVLVGHDAAVLRNEMLLRPIMHFLPGEYSPLPSKEGLKASGKAALSGIGHTLKTFGGVTENPNLSVLRGENGANPPSQLHSPEITTGLPWADAILRGPQRVHFELPRAASGAEFQSGLDDYASRNARAQKLADPSIDEAKAKAELIANPTPAMKEAAHNYAAEAMWFNDSATTWVMSQIDSGLKRFEKVSPPAAAIGKYLRSSQIPFARIASNAIGDAIETSMGYTGVPTAYKLAKFKGQNLIAMNKAIDDAMKLGTDQETATSDAKAQYGKLSPEQQISVKKTIAKAIIGGIAVAIGVGLHRQGILTAPGDPAKYDPGSLQVNHKSMNVGYYEPIASPFLHGALIDQMAQKWALGEPPSFADIANLYMKPLENAPLVGPVSALAEGTDKGLARFVANLIPTPTIVAEAAATFDPTHSVRAKQSVLDYKRNQFPGKAGRNGLPIQTVPQKYVNNEPTLRENGTIPESGGLGLGPKTLPLRPGYLEDEKNATQAEVTAYQRAVLRALAKRRAGSQ